MYKANINKKYKLLKKDTIQVEGQTLYRIQALRDIPGVVHKGELGGYIASESNLSHKWDCWVGDDAKVYDNAQVGDKAWIGGNARVFGGAWVSGYAQVYDNAWVSDNARILDNAQVYDNTRVYNNAWLDDNVLVCDNVHVGDNVKVGGKIHIGGNIILTGQFKLYSKEMHVIKTNNLVYIGGIEL